MKPLTPGYIYVLLVPYVAAISSVRGSHGQFSFAGFKYTGWLWLFTLGAGIALLIADRDHVRMPLLPWLPWTAYIFLSLVWVGLPGIDNFQLGLQITMPILVGAVASVYIRHESQLRSLRNAFGYSLIILAAVSLAVSRENFAGATLTARPMAMTSTLIACVFVGSNSIGRIARLAGWTVCLGLAVFSGSRMATAVTLSLWLVTPSRQSVVSRIGRMLLLGALGFAVVQAPPMQQRLIVPEDQADVKLAFGIQGTGRFEAWPRLWEEARRNLVQGVGIGGFRPIVARVWPGMTWPHNDYLRVILELGLVGLLCFLSAVAFQLRDALRGARESGGEVSSAFATAYLGFITLLVFSATDNVISYNIWFVNPLFCVLGAAYGASSPKSTPRVDDDRTPDRTGNTEDRESI